MATNNNQNGNSPNSQEDGDQANLIEAMQAWMVVRLADELKLTPVDIDRGVPFMSYGLDSQVAFSLTGELADLVGRELPTTLLWDFPTIQALAFHLVDDLKDEKTAESVAAEIGHFFSRLEELPENETLSDEKQRK